jgi:ATP-dependent Clp protease ATP-binding subunit ClpC
MSDPLDITDVNKLVELMGNKDLGADVLPPIDEAAMSEALRARVLGQDHVIDDLVHLLRLQFAKKIRKRPVANILFLGPTGTGKTELGKAIAEYLYGDEKNALLFDGPNFSREEHKSQLIGVPGGYVNANAGGQLTRPVLNNPKRVILFDEIEKAYSGIYDLFLSMMGDGRLTEAGSGRNADFTKSVIILTSNAEHEAIGKIQEQIADPHEQIDAVKKHLRDAKVFRPEILGRFDKIYIFKPLEGLNVARIAALKMKNLAKEYGLELNYVDPALIVEAMDKGNKLKEFGVRELERVVGDMLGESMLTAREAGVDRIKITLDGDDLQIEPA